MKTCTKCATEKPVEQFNRDKTRRDGRFPWCKSCKRGGDREGHAKFRPTRNAKARARYRADPEPYIARARARYLADPEAIIAQTRAWALANPDRRREIRRASQARRWAADPDRFREAWRRRKAAVKRGVEIYAFTTEQLTARIAYYGGLCWMCRGPADCIDHVKPLIAGGPHMLANLRPACTGCNARKAGQWPWPLVVSPPRGGAVR